MGRCNNPIVVDQTASAHDETVGDHNLPRPLRREQSSNNLKKPERKKERNNMHTYQLCGTDSTPPTILPIVIGSFGVAAGTPQSWLAAEPAPMAVVKLVG